MPIYVYKCNECSSLTEEYFHHTDGPDNIECKNCGSSAKRIITAASIHVSGYDNAKSKLQKLLQEDRKRLAKGDMEFAHNLIGDAKSHTDSGVKTLDQVSGKSAIKRKN